MVRHQVTLLNVDRLIYAFYILIPTLFYGTPWLISLADGGLTLHFFYTFYVESKTFLFLLLGHLALGAGITAAIKPTSFHIKLSHKRSIPSDFLAVTLFALYFRTSGFASALIFPLFIALIARRWPHGISFLAMLAIATIELIFSQDRYPVILVLLLWSLPSVSKYTFKRITALGFAALFFLIFILQPLRAGLIPFADASPLGDFAYFAIHLQPIYIGAYISNSVEWSINVLWAESVPMLKSILGTISVTESVAEVGLPSEVIDAGTRLGSNSSMYFSITGCAVILYGLFFFNTISNLYHNNLFRNTLLLTLILQGPYFIRRSFGSLIIDIVVLFFAVLFIVLLQKVRTLRKPAPDK